MIVNGEWYPYEICKNGTECTMEIDYERLRTVISQAIVDAEKPSQKKEDSEVERIGFWKAIFMIIKGTNKTDGTLTSKILASLLSVGFNVLAVLCLLVVPAALIAFFRVAPSMIWVAENIASDILVVIFFAIIVILALLVALIFRGAANEIEGEQDRDYVVAVFSGVVSFVALIVALIALLEGVG